MSISRTTVNINLNEWNHVCVTMGDAFKVYVDGASRFSQPLTDRKLLYDILANK